MEQFILGCYARNYKKINSKNYKKYHRAEALGLVTICVVHPCSYAHACALLESETEGAVAAVAAFACQQLGYDGVSGCKYLVVTPAAMALPWRNSKYKAAMRGVTPVTP